MDTKEKPVVVVYLNEEGIISAGLEGQEQKPVELWSHRLKDKGITITDVKLLELFVEKNPGRICIHNPYTCQTCCFP
jgi:hypothetical protein